MTKKTRGSVLRILHGPENIGGIGRFLADWQREKKGAKSDFIVYRDNTPFQNSHQNLHLEKYPRLISLFHQVSFLLHCLRTYDLFHFYFGKSLLPLNADLPVLKIFGKKIIMNYVGSDIRLNSVELRRHDYYHLRMDAEKKKGPPEFLKRIKLAWHSLWCDRFIAPRNLFAHAKEIFLKEKIIHHIWTTNTIELPSSLQQIEQAKIPLILHAATNPERKGTRFVVDTINNLKNKGLTFDFISTSDMPHEELIRILKEKADIVVDSPLSGGFGNLAMEAMAHGKPVCGYIIEEIRALIPDLPVVQCTIENLEEKLGGLIKNPVERARLGKAGYEFAKRYYDRTKTCEELWVLYLEVINQ